MFGGEAMDEEPLDQKMVTKSIERAQRQVEEYNFEIRKNVVKYDDVMNKQRLVIYKMRQDVLEDRDVSGLILEMMDETIYDALDEYTPEGVQPEEWDMDGLIKRLKLVFGFEPDMDRHASGNTDEMHDVFKDQVLTEYQNREKSIGEELRESYKEQVGGDDSDIDFATLARKRVHDLEKMALLEAVDEKWIVHLYSMDYLKESVRMRALGQRDPLLEYKTEGFDMFQLLLLSIYERTLQSLFRVTSPNVRKKREISTEKTVEEQSVDALDKYSDVAAESQSDQSFSSFDKSRFNLAGQGRAEGANGQTNGAGPSGRPKGNTVRRTGEKVKPNDPCPCGSGKKYKKCCGAN
jgi:preprotein translocase subunit SecA